MTNNQKRKILSISLFKGVDAAYPVMQAYGSLVLEDISEVGEIGASIPCVCISECLLDPSVGIAAQLSASIV